MKEVRRIDKYMNSDHLKNQKLNTLNSELNEIMRKSELLIAEFMRLTRDVPKRTYSLLRFFSKNSNTDMYNNFRRVDEELKEVMTAITRFRTTNIDYLSTSTATYISTYEEYLQSVEAATKLRVALELKFMELNIWTSSTEDVNEVIKLSKMIDPSLEACQRNAQKVKVMAEYF
jgi:hypothetical protein